ncbi:MAG: pirin family protein [Candidatus Zixiibacteriota bacterium]
MIKVRKSNERGHFDHGWLDTYHTFSFAHYNDPDFMGFGSLCVLNEDKIQPGTEFGSHPHKDMEIITYLLSGELTHKDSMGNGSTIYPGDIQRMTAGSGIFHSESNNSKYTTTHLFQIWVFPDKKGRQPEYEQKTFPFPGKQNALRMIISPDGTDNTIRIHQDLYMYDSTLERGQSLTYRFVKKRCGWIQLASGELHVNGDLLAAGDGAAISSERDIIFKAETDCEFILFDLA